MSRKGQIRQTLSPALVLCFVAVLAQPLDRDGKPHPTALSDPPVAAAARPFSAPERAAANALRTGDCSRAATEIAGSGGAEARVLAGLYAHSCASHAVSLRHHLETGDYRGRLEDWRLWTLAESALALGQRETAQQALTRLVSGHPASPLAGLAAAAGAELALERGDLPTAGRLIASGRALDLEPRFAERLEGTAWRLATRLEDEEGRRGAARRLLVCHPLEAAALEVVEVFRDPTGSVEWQTFLTPPELVRRAEALIAEGVFDAAVETLTAVSTEARDRHWDLLRAEALTRDRRGAEALATLEPLPAQNAREEAALEWMRARSALEASVARRGRSTSSQYRRRMRRVADDHLRRVVELAADPDLSRRALAILFDHLSAEERFEESLEVLRALRRLDPADETGAATLWRLGWREHERRNPSSAIGYWTELRELYPDSSAARRALYWSARAHRQLGNVERSQDLLREVVAVPVADFYHRHAMEWLSVPPPPRPPPLTPPELWPRDPLLDRARWLSEVGLDEAAATEIELLAESADPRAARALKAEILARQGRRRQSIIELRRAFPTLGTQHQHRAPKAALELYYPLDFHSIITAAAERHELSTHLVFAMIRQESAFDAGAHSRAGARGLMQVMPTTGRELAGRLGLSYSRGRLADPDFSVALGTAYYRQVLRSLGDEELALAGYNAGPSRVRRLWARSGNWDEVDRFVENLPFEETRTYVKRVVLLANSYRDLYEG